MKKLTAEVINDIATKENALFLTVLKWYQLYKGCILPVGSSCAACDTAGNGHCATCVLSVNSFTNSICDDIIDGGYREKNIYRRLLYLAGFTFIKKYKASVPKKYHKFF